MVDTGDLKSPAPCEHASSNLASGTFNLNEVFMRAKTEISNAGEQLLLFEIEEVVRHFECALESFVEPEITKHLIFEAVDGSFDYEYGDISGTHSVHTTTIYLEDADRVLVRWSEHSDATPFIDAPAVSHVQHEVGCDSLLVDIEITWHVMSMTCRRKNKPAYDNYSVEAGPTLWECEVLLKPEFDVL